MAGLAPKGAVALVFAVRDSEPLCPWCAEQSRCPREFSFAPSEHEIVLGTVPVNSITAKRLLRQVRSWIEASQSYEKNQLGLGKMYLNSLRYCWTMTLLADTVCLLRAHTLLKAGGSKPLLTDLIPKQIPLDLGLFPEKPNAQNHQ